MTDSEQVPNVVDYLYARFVSHDGDKALPVPTGILFKFLTFAKKDLAANPAANPVYLQNGLGAKMANGDYVSLGAETSGEAGGMDNATAVHVTYPKTVPGMGGISDTSSIPITGKRN